DVVPEPYTRLGRGDKTASSCLKPTWPTSDASPRGPPPASSPQGQVDGRLDMQPSGREPSSRPGIWSTRGDSVAGAHDLGRLRGWRSRSGRSPSRKLRGALAH